MIADQIPGDITKATARYVVSVAGTRIESEITSRGKDLSRMSGSIERRGLGSYFQEQGQKPVPEIGGFLSGNSGRCVFQLVALGEYGLLRVANLADYKKIRFIKIFGIVENHPQQITRKLPTIVSNSPSGQWSGVP